MKKQKNLSNIVEKNFKKPVVLDKTQTSIKIALAGGSPVE